MCEIKQTEMAYQSIRCRIQSGKFHIFMIKL